MSSNSSLSFELIPKGEIENKYNLLVRSNQYWKDLGQYRGNGRFGTLTHGEFESGETFIVYHVQRPSTVYLAINQEFTPSLRVPVISEDITPIRIRPEIFIKYATILLDNYSEKNNKVVCKCK